MSRIRHDSLRDLHGVVHEVYTTTVGDELHTVFERCSGKTHMRSLMSRDALTCIQCLVLQVRFG